MTGGPYAVMFHRDGPPERLAMVDGDRSSRAYAVNNNGVIVGGSYGASGTGRPVVWQRDGKLIDLTPRLAALGDIVWGEATAISDGGLVAGALEYRNASGRRARRAFVVDLNGTARPPHRRADQRHRG